MRKAVCFKPVSSNTMMKYMDLICRKMESTLRQGLPEEFGLIFDGWTEGNDHMLLYLLVTLPEHILLHSNRFQSMISVLFSTQENNSFLKTPEKISASQNIQIVDSKSKSTDSKLFESQTEKYFMVHQEP